jgi:hypothetical protein
MFFHGQRLKLRLFKDFNQSFPARQLSLSGRIQVAAKGGKRFQFTKLGQIQTQVYRPPVSWLLPGQHRQHEKPTAQHLWRPDTGKKQSLSR